MGWNLENEEFLLEKEINRLRGIIGCVSRPNVLNEPDSPPQLTLELIPTTARQHNIRNLIPRQGWNKIRNGIAKQAKRRCQICGTKTRSLHTHEIWQYDDSKHIQRLEGLIALCHACHYVKHLDISFLENRGPIESYYLDIEKGLSKEPPIAFKKNLLIVEHLAKVNGWPLNQALKYIEEQLEIWKNRSTHIWRLLIDKKYVNAQQIEEKEEEVQKEKDLMEHKLALRKLPGQLAHAFNIQDRNKRSRLGGFPSGSWYKFIPENVDEFIVSILEHYNIPLRPLEQIVKEWAEKERKGNEAKYLGNYVHRLIRSELNGEKTREENLERIKKYVFKAITVNNRIYEETEASHFIRFTTLRKYSKSDAQISRLIHDISSYYSKRVHCGKLEHPDVLEDWIHFSPWIGFDERLVLKNFRLHSTLHLDEMRTLDETKLAWKRWDYTFSKCFFESIFLNGKANWRFVRKWASEKLDAKNDIRNIPIIWETSLMTSQRIIGIRALHPRAYEPWTEMEDEILLKEVKKNDNFDELAVIFQRQLKEIIGRLVLYNVIDINPNEEKDFWVRWIEAPYRLW